MNYILMAWLCLIVLVLGGCNAKKEYTVRYKHCPPIKLDTLCIEDRPITLPLLSDLERQQERDITTISICQEKLNVWGEAYDNCREEQ